MQDTPRGSDHSPVVKMNEECRDAIAFGVLSCLICLTHFGCPLRCVVSFNAFDTTLSIDSFICAIVLLLTVFRCCFQGAH